MSSVIETAGLSNTNVGTLRCLFEVMEHKITARWHTPKMMKLKKKRHTFPQMFILKNLVFFLIEC